MKALLFFISLFLIFIIIYITIRMIEKVLSIFKGLLKILVMATFVLSAIALFSMPEEFGTLLQPILVYLSPLVDFALNAIQKTYEFVKNLPDYSMTLVYYIAKAFE